MSDSLYAKYLAERTDIQIIESEFGFITYSLSGDECYIRDLYVLPEFRKEGLATKLANQVTSIAKVSGCHYIAGSVCPTTKGAEASVRILMAYGMRLHSAAPNLIIFKKDIV